MTEKTIDFRDFGHRLAIYRGSLHNTNETKAAKFLWDLVNDPKTIESILTYQSKDFLAWLCDADIDFVIRELTTTHQEILTAYQNGKAGHELDLSVLQPTTGSELHAL